MLITIAAVVLVGCGNPEADNALKSALNLESAKQAIANGANVKAKDERGWTALHFAQTKEIAELLIAKGADVNAQDEDGETPLDYANRVKQTEIAALLRNHGGKTSAELSIHVAAEQGNNKAVKQHLAAGADVNAKNKHGETPLDIVAHPWNPNKNKAETAGLLRKHGGKTSEELKAEGK